MSNLTHAGVVAGALGGPELVLIATNNRVPPLAEKLARLRKQVQKLARRAASRVSAIFGKKIPENAAEAKEAVRHFLKEMDVVAARTYPAWRKTLDDALAECQLNYDDRRALLDVHPIDDYYFAAVVALEAAKLRNLYPPAEATELLGEIGDQVDAASGRQDRVVSDLVFSLVGRIDLGAGVDRMKMPYDTVVKGILQHMGFAKNELTRALLRDVAFRHLLGEPLALGIPQWWKAFQSKFMIYWEEPKEEELEDDDLLPPAPAAIPAVLVPARRRLRRRATAF